jgi:thiosulfate dehydrogenase (quinone) large subunit
MLMKWLRENTIAAGLLALVRVWFGWQWMTAGWGKITGGFDASGFLKGSIAKPVVSHGEVLYPNFTGFLESFALPNVKLINFLIPWGEFLVGLGLILGCLTTAAAFFGIMMNFMFMFGGTVSSNPWYILWTFIILAAGFNAGRFGADHYVIPYLRSLFNKKLNPSASTNKA